MNITRNALASMSKKESGVKAATIASLLQRRNHDTEQELTPVIDGSTKKKNSKADYSNRALCQE
jgi:hypothetical protein